MKNYLFDFDGTLVDSMPTYISALLRVLDENRITYGPETVKIITPLGLSKTAEYYIGLGLDMQKNEIVSTMKKYLYDDYFYTIPAKANVISVLRSLKEQGAGLHVLTASPHITLDACLKRIGIYDIFDNVWSCEDFGTTKADPEIYKKAAEKIGDRIENILFLDDNIEADKTAKLAGMKVCGVFDESSRHYTEHIKEETDYYIYDFSELLSIDF
ncbi:MAG: HAD family phosphatase [Ruminococcaceae bacterium]|nr:HAD family phosphatase [Oscillospiraceae bacterium]